MAVSWTWRSHSAAKGLLAATLVHLVLYTGSLPQAYGSPNANALGQQGNHAAAGGQQQLVGDGSRDAPRSGVKRLPWQMPSKWTPPYAQYVNDLAGLIGAVTANGEKWVTVYALSHLLRGSMEQRLLLNSITSLVLLGRTESYLVLALSDTALAECVRLRLPCLNAVPYVRDDAGTDDEYVDGCWRRVLATREVLRALPNGTHLHWTDPDVVYLKGLHVSIHKLMFEKASGHADLSIAVEDVVWSEKTCFIGNMGVGFMLNQQRSLDFYDMLLQERPKYPEEHDQEVLCRSFGKVFLPCSSPFMCQIVHNMANLPAVVRHNTAWLNNGGCTDCEEHEPAPDSHSSRPTFTCYSQQNPRHCEVRERLYVHAICHYEKQPMLRGLGLWFLDLRYPMRTNASAIAAAGLPCPEGQDVADMYVVA